jgi:tetrahydromethanopterin S-methyltransferase subunit F
MSDERTITRAVGLLLGFVFVVILILGAISY